MPGSPRCPGGHAAGPLTLTAVLSQSLTLPQCAIVWLEERLATLFIRLSIIPQSVTNAVCPLCLQKAYGTSERHRV